MSDDATTTARPTPPSTSPQRPTPQRRRPTGARRAATIAYGHRLRHTTPMLDALDREWDRMRLRPRTLQRARTWAGDPVLASVVSDLRDLDDLLRATEPGRSCQPGSCDEVLRRLIALASDDELAGRIVLQRTLPGLICRSRRWDGHVRGADVCDIAVGAAWIAIRGFDVDARTRNVAPSLISDALWIAFRRGARRKVEQEVPVPSRVLAAHAAPTHEASPMAALAGTLRAARTAGVPSADVDVMRLLAATGSPTQAARISNVTARTIRNRRDTASWNIRRALGPDWADWTDPLVAA